MAATADDPLDSSTALNTLKLARSALREAEDALKAAKERDIATWSAGSRTDQLEKQREGIEAARAEVERRRRALEVASEEHREASRVRDGIAAEKLAKSNSDLAKTNTEAARTVACWTKVLAFLALAQVVTGAAQACSACSSRASPPQLHADAGASTGDR